MNPFYKNLSLWLVIILMMIVLYNVFNSGQRIEKPINYTEFLTKVQKDEVIKVTMQDRNLRVMDVNQNVFRVYAPDDPELIKILNTHNIEIEAKPPSESPWFEIIISWLPMIILIGVWIFFMRQMQSGGGGKALSFGKSRARLLSDEKARVTFDDVAGVEEAKEELAEVVEFLRDPKKFTRLGGRIPKGVLLVGPPGTGKTLLARAIAGEAEVPFFTISGSDFVEMFVGVGASRVRDLFAQAKKNAPCIVFIDEIDAVGRQRGAGLGGGHDEREQTLNQLLVEMDGFESNEGVILISATNRPDVLDPALLRPGRFDRQVVVDLPDIRGREGILRVHMKKTPLADDVDPLILAKGTPGFSGADLENMVNEAALLAAKRDQEKIRMVDFDDAKDKVYMGLERKSKVIREEDRINTAYHEGGHALVARFLPFTDDVNKVTIIPRGRAAGLTWYLPDERDTVFKEQLLNRLAICLGGRVAEEIIYDRLTTGAYSDIKSATELANKMVRDYGMSKKLGPLSYSLSNDQVFLGREISQHRDYSEETARIIDREVSEFVLYGYNAAKTILTDNVDILHKIKEALLEKETMMGAELDALILSMRPGLTIPALQKDYVVLEEKVIPPLDEEANEEEPQDNE